MITLFGFSVFYIMSAVVQAIILAGVISLVVILFTVMMFLGYDALRNHQQTANSLVLESKRLFIRYVSHEIRGPLNTVHLGLKLLIQEMEEARAELSSSTNNSVTVGVLDDGNDNDNDCVMSSRLVEWVALIDELELSTERGKIGARICK
jgi:signal transduction histidine kinase